MPAHKRDIKLIKKIALTIKELRADAGVTQDEVYDATKVNVARIERHIGNPTVSTLSELCKYFKISWLDFNTKVALRK